MTNKNALTFVGIIPARYNSTRLPGKPLKKIGNKTMIQRVYEQAMYSNELNEVIVATDQQNIVEHVQSFGGKAMLTSPKHESGTERCAEVIQSLKYDFDIVVNIQGDEPFIEPKQIELLANIFKNNPSVEIATLIKKIDNPTDLWDHNKPKVIINKNLEALYFSRQTIPFVRDVNPEEWLQYQPYYKHIGLYAYTKEILKKIVQLPVSSLEKSEKLEQLRWLENGYKILTATTPFDSFGIDTPEDLIRANQLV